MLVAWFGAALLAYHVVRLVHCLRSHVGERADAGHRRYAWGSRACSVTLGPLSVLLLCPTIGPCASLVRLLANPVMLNMGARSEEYHRVMFELMLRAVVPGEPAAQLRANLVALTAWQSRRTQPPAGAVERNVSGLRVDIR
jgi:hypothetical protein